MSNYPIEIREKVVQMYLAGKRVSEIAETLNLDYFVIRRMVRYSKWFKDLLFYMQNKKKQDEQLLMDLQIDNKIETKIQVEREVHLDPIINYPDIENPKYVLLVSCCKRKRPDYEYLSALNMYDGPTFKTLRKYLRTCGKAIEIKILSSKYGLIDSNLVIKKYNHKIQHEDISILKEQIVDYVKTLTNIKGLCINVSLPYEEATKDIEFILPQKVITRAKGTGIGERKGAMKKWLYSLPCFGAVPEGQQQLLQLKKGNNEE